ncbi:MAG: caspase family protein [Acidobacteriota bacterium]|nr:MAG: caspase family protein [Acidobacteriota bacterium]
MAKITKPAAKKVKAISLHIGLNSVSPAHYGGWSGDLMACEFDARDMAAIAKASGMKPTVLLTKEGTRAATLAAIRSAAKQLKSGGLFFLSYSGHGGQIPDVTSEEDDKKDETWCLYDGQLIDDELYMELGRFKSGVRILVFSDSCHSGTVTRAPMAVPAGPVRRSKMMPPAVGMRTYNEHKAFYDKLQQDVAKSAGRDGQVDPDSVLAQLTVSSRLASIAGKFKPAVILISGCQDNQTSLDGDHNGAFTEQLLQVWNNGKFRGNYARFHAMIKSRMPADQTPNFFTMGRVSRFVIQQPFSV